MRINTNILSLSAQHNLATTTRALARAMEKLASGSRINSARDDAAGLATASGLEAQRRALLRIVKNANEALGFLNTADGVLNEQINIIGRLRELALQAANGTFSLNATYATGANPRGVTVGDFDDDGALDLASKSSAGLVAIFMGDTTSSVESSFISLLTQGDAEDALEILDSATATILSSRAEIGALQNRLEIVSTISALTSESISAAYSQIHDVDYASETAEFTRLQILQQAGLAVLSQANISQQLSLKLLKNL